MTLGRRLAPSVFLAPTLILGTVFFVLPLVLSLGLSFATWNSLAPPRFAGLANYRYLLTRDPLFYAFATVYDSRVTGRILRRGASGSRRLVRRGAIGGRMK